MKKKTDRNPRMIAGLRILAILMAIVLPATTTSAAERPNVVVLLADDLGYKDLGCDGGPVKTPTVDGLAASGVRFTDFYSGASVCSPSRATLLTGRQHIRTGVYTAIFDEYQNWHLLEREVTLAEVLKSHGYNTAHFGKWHLGLPRKDRNKPTPAEHGFDYWFGTSIGSPAKDPSNYLRNGERVGKLEGYASHLVIDDAISWLDKERDPDAPFFLNIWFYEPHDPVGAPDDLVSQYGALDDQGAVYSACIDNTDRAIARLLDKLKEIDDPENTLIIYSSDNGSQRPDRVGNLRGWKAFNYEGGIRVPGIFSWPGTITKGHLERQPAGLVDLLPTVCGLLEIDKPDGVFLDGSDISPLLTNRASEFTRHQPLFWHLSWSDLSLAIRDGNYSMVAYRDYEIPRDKRLTAEILQEIKDLLTKVNSPELDGWINRTDKFHVIFKKKEAEALRRRYIRAWGPQESWVPAMKSGSYRQFELYDLATDPGQQNDLSGKLPEVHSRLKKKLLELNANAVADGHDWHLID